MSARVIQKSVLLKTSAASDVQNGGGFLTIAGLESVPKVNITSISQSKYKAEVPQVVTLFGTAYTPVASTIYKMTVYDPLRVSAGYQEAPKYYSYTTPAVLSGVAATDRETIHLALVAAINADASNHAVAASLGGGTGITVTDDGGYYPPKAQNMTNVKGPNTVLPITNTDGTGFAADNYVITTAAVFSSGVGALLLADAPVVDYTFGNLISGSFKAPATATNPPTYAVSGQNYDIFAINSLKVVSGTTLTEQYVYQVQQQLAVVDNGTGSSTTNLAGFKAFERAMLHEIFQTYSNDQSSIIFMGDTGVVTGGLGTGLPSGTSLAENVISFGNGFSTHYFPLGTATILSPVSTNSGLLLQLDVTAGEGIELSAPTWTNSNKNFTVGKTAASVYCKISVTDITGVNPVWVGFRKQAAANTTYTSYTDYALIGLGDALGNIYTSTELNGGGNTNTDTTQNWANTETHTLQVNVDINGAVTFKLDGYAPTVTQSFTFDAGDVLIPVFGYALQAGSGSAVNLLEAAFVNSDSWRS